MRTFAALGLAFVLCACVHRPDVAILSPSSGAIPAGARFELAGDDAADRAVGAALVGRGFQAAGAGEPAELVVQAALAEKPRVVGALAPVDERDPQWLTRGAPIRPWSLGRRTYVLSVAIHDLRGREVFRSLASQPARRSGVTTAMPGLAVAAVAPLRAHAVAAPQS